MFNQTNLNRMKNIALQERVNNFMAGLIARNPNEPEFHQAAREVIESIMPYIEENPIYQDEKILERITEPERIIIFRVPWIDDKGNIQINRGYRIEMNSAIGPYKGDCAFTQLLTWHIEIPGL